MPSKRITRCLLLAALPVLGLAVLLASSCAAPALARDTVRIAVLAPRGLGTLDPHFATAHYDRMAASWLHGALVRFRPGSISPGDIEPDLAERWEMSPDGLTWTFFLRAGVTFHDGSPVTADDVAFSLRKAATPATSAYAADFTAVDSVTVVDPATVRIVLRQPIPSLLGLLANYSGGFILSRQALAAGGDPAAAAIGFGPFRLESQSAGQEAASFVANDSYFRGAPRLRRIEYRFVSALSTSDLAFNAGEVDIIEGQQDQAWINRTRQSPNTAVDVIEPAEISLLHLNVTQKPLDDPRVRRAIALAVNRPELVSWRGKDLARAARSVVPAGYLGFADADAPATDIAEAKRLLAEAGYPNGLTLTTIHTQNPVMLGAIQVVQAELRRAGIDLDVQVVEHQTYHQMIRKDLSPVVHYAAARFPVADTMLTQFFHSRSIVATPTAVTNFSHCTVADSDLDEARGDTDLERQLMLWSDAQRKIVAAGCAVPLLETLQVWARRADFDYGFAFKGSMSTGPLLTERSHFTP
ncbi:MAG: ABC transporter substrate-binding protein [Acetobacteraceae bacterium]